MKLAVFTDFHRGFSQKTHLIHQECFNQLKQESFDGILVCGDWGTAKLEHVKGAFKVFRESFPDKPIYGVLGNHEFWDKKESIAFIEHSINVYAQRYNIQLLENNPIIQDEFILSGFNGWYHHTDPKSGDSVTWIRPWTNGMTTDDYFRSKEKVAFENLLKINKENKKLIVVSHFPCVIEAMDKEEYCGNPSYGEKLINFADVLFFGHTHQEMDFKKENTRIINIGSGYQEVNGRIKEICKYKIFNLKEI